MWSRWASRWRQSREKAALERRAIADDLWKRTLVRYPFLRRGSDPGGGELRRLASLFLDRKEFVATGGLRLTNDVAVAVAAQACLPILRLGLEAYDSFVGIVLHPDQVRANRVLSDEDGVVHEFEDALAGEMVDGGPVMLSWRDVRSAGQDGDGVPAPFLGVRGQLLRLPLRLDRRYALPHPSRRLRSR